jgi:general secretion pathway protein G
MQAKRGFTLVEILIVVVILGILAAIVVPQFTQASTEAKFNSLCSNLQSIRSQIELYKVQHNDVPPGNTVAGGVISAALDSFDEQMVYTTDIDGGINGTSKARTGDFKYGPYLERVPANPFNGLTTIVAITDPCDAGSGAAGWAYDPATGEIYADDDVDASHAGL